MQKNYHTYGMYVNAFLFFYPLKRAHIGYRGNIGCFDTKLTRTGMAREYKQIRIPVLKNLLGDSAGVFGATWLGV